MKHILQLYARDRMTAERIAFDFLLPHKANSLKLSYYDDNKKGKLVTLMVRRKKMGDGINQYTSKAKMRKK